MSLTDDFQVTARAARASTAAISNATLRGGHGRVDLRKAIAQSCDVFFYTLGNKMGIDNIAKYAEMAGLGSQDRDRSAARVRRHWCPPRSGRCGLFREKWYAGETISVSIGQGALTVTPLQLAHAIGGIATGGIWTKPHLVMDQAAREGARKADINIDERDEGDRRHVRRREWRRYRRSRELPGLEVCGKTGTAQLASNDVLKGTRWAQR